ncbi:MAG: YdcF family protein, partial [Desulfobacteraceae bacterium]|nr:YdcF family protein [Desulfobacteraceae bacterium]
MKKILAPLFFPLSLCLEILLAGIFLLWFTRRHKTGKIIVSLGVVFLIALSYGAASETLLRPLEYKYPSMTDMSAVLDIEWVVVLSGGSSSDAHLPITGRLSHASLVRLVEGIRIHRKLPKSKLILSGGGAFNTVAEAKTMADVAVILGVDSMDLILELESKDTKDQA